MGKLSVNQDNRTFLCDGKPFFWLADTLWSLFTNMTDQEIDSYLTLRKQQGYNALQINILPQWDRCWVKAPYMPFELKEDGVFDYEKPMKQEYFDNASRILDKVVSYGFIPALVVLWSNYVPGNWASRINGVNVMPKDLIVPYCEKVFESFDQYDPVYIISGDTDFDKEECCEYYQIAMNKMTELSPTTLKTLHIKGRYTYLPDGLVDKMDFYMYQSGHNGVHLDKCYTMPEEMLSRYPAKPLLNAEPCYEQMGYSGNKYGRFNQKDIRRAAWMSVLSGAGAGITYGAHGVWNWQKLNMPVNPNAGEGFDAAKPCTEALQFSGAWDYGYLKDIVTRYGALLPDDKIGNVTKGFERVTDEAGEVQMISVSNPNPEIKMASTADGKASLIYAPFNTKIIVKEDLSHASIKVIDLVSKNIASPVVEVKEGVSYIQMCPFDEDVLVVIERSTGIRRP